MGIRVAWIAAVIALGCGASESGDRSGGPGTFGALPELELWGYLRTETTGLATDVAPGPISFESIRQSTDRTHALIHVSGFT
jgi:hypothetical protein